MSTCAEALVSTANNKHNMNCITYFNYIFMFVGVFYILETFFCKILISTCIFWTYPFRLQTTVHYLFFPLFCT